MPDFNYQLTGDQIPKNGDFAYSESDVVICETASGERVQLTYGQWLRQRTTITIISGLIPQPAPANSSTSLPRFVPDQPIS